METATAISTTKLEAKIRGHLDLITADKAVRHLLPLLGLFGIDFPSKDLTVIWDHEGVSITCKAKFSNNCTCAEHAKDPKVIRLDDGEMHASFCDQSKAFALVQNPNLVDLNEDDSGMIWTFQWPRSIAEVRDYLINAFPALENDAEWAHFAAGWHEIVGFMPPAKPSVYQIANADAPGPALDFGDGLDFGEETANVVPFAGIEVGTQDQEQPAPPDGTLQDGPEPFPSTSMPGVDLVDLPPEGAPKKKRGRPAGTTKAAQEAKQDIPAGAFEPEKKEDGKVRIPACVKFAQFADEEVCRLRTIIENIKEAEKFPTETIKILKNAFDRLALRTAHLEFRGLHDTDDPKAINPLVEVSLANVSAEVTTAVRDLCLAPEKPKSWEDFCKALKEAKELADSVNDVISQTGAAPCVQEPPRLKTPDGKTLME